MKAIVALSAILFISVTASASETKGSSCEWLLNKWKCSHKNPWSGMDETEYYNIVRSSESSFRLNFHPARVPEADSYSAMEVYLDGRINESTSSSSVCESSRLVINFLGNQPDESSVFQSHEFVESSNGVQLIKSYYNTGDVTFYDCTRL